MENKESEKAAVELRKLRMELKAMRFHLYFDAAKTLAIFLGAVIVFWAIQQPESVLNRESSKDTIVRERAKLILEWIKEKDPTRREEALAVINAVYGTSENEWLKAVEFALKQRTQVEALTDLFAQKRGLEDKRDQLFERLMKELTGKAGAPGAGPMYMETKNELARLDQGIAALSSKIDARRSKGND